MGTQLGTDSLGRAIYACTDCATVDGAPYTHCSDNRHRCWACVRTYGAEQAVFASVGQEALASLRRLEAAASIWIGSPSESDEAIIEARRIIRKADEALKRIRAARTTVDGKKP